MLRIGFFIRLAKANDKGAPIYCQVNYKGKSVQFSTGHRINKNDWDSASTRVKRPRGQSGIKNIADSINEDLDHIRTKIMDARQFVEANDPEFTVHDIVEKYRGKSSRKKITFLFVMDKLVEIKKHEFNKGIIKSDKTVGRYEQVRDELSDFIDQEYRKKDLGLEEIKPGFIQGYEMWLGKRMSQSTVNKHVQKLGSGIKLAFSNGWISYDPFSTYKYKHIKIKIKFHTQEELQALEDHIFASDYLTRVRDVYLFSCYSGLAWNEYYRLAPEHIFNYMNKNIPFIKIDREKTGETMTVPLLPKAAEILKKYENDPYCIEKGKCLPVISNAKMNKYLKEVGIIVGVSRIKMTTHIGRSTFATTVALNNGVPIETVSKILGHRDIKTTLKYYAEIVDEKMFNDVDDLIKKVESAIKVA